MSQGMFFSGEATEGQIYEEITSRISYILPKEDNLLSNLANFTALLKEAFGKISWAGFYLYDGKRLYLGPFQGKIACTNIEIGKGVCGTAAELGKTVIVGDVEKFPGHIACDPNSRSEIVVPLYNSDKSLYGVLDLDSNLLNAFSEIDQNALEKLVNYFEQNLIPGN